MDDNAAISERAIERVDRSGRRTDKDRLVVEAPLELRAAGEPAVVIMRTPGDDDELALGLMFAEGVVSAAAELAAMHRPEGLAATERGNVLELGPPPAGDAWQMPERTLYSTSSCGVCGKTSIAALETRAAAIRSDLRVPPALVRALPDRLADAQSVFAATGGLHAAGAFDPEGALLAVREDIGRHNAVDKVVGWALAAGLTPVSESILCVSGRLSFEIVQKAIVAGFPIVVAVSAPSSLAVDLAERFGVTLCGFTRGDRFNLYSHSTRIG